MDVINNYNWMVDRLKRSLNSCHFIEAITACIFLCIGMCFMYMANAAICTGVVVLNTGRRIDRLISRPFRRKRSTHKNG